MIAPACVDRARLADQLRRFFAKIEVHAGTGCWIWRGSLVPSGQYHGIYYGHCKRSGRNWLAHRWIYTVLIGSIPDGHEVHHTCGVHRCVYPGHLRATGRPAHLAEHNGYHEMEGPDELECIARRPGSDDPF